MTSFQENRLSMLYKLHVYFTTYLAALIVAIPALAALVTLFNDLLVKLEGHESEATTTTTGVTAYKNEIRVSMIERTVIIAKAFVGYHTSVKNTVTADYGKIVKSKLDRMSDTRVFFACDRIRKLCTPFDVNLIPFGIEAAEVAALTADIELYRELMGTPHDAISKKVAQGQMVDRDFVAIFALLFIIDGIMEAVKLVLPEAYLQYINDRRIDDNAGANGGPPSLTLVIPPNSYFVGIDQPYLGYRAYRVKNLSSDIIYWGLSTSIAEFTNTPRILDGNSISNIRSTTLGADGNYLLFHNDTGVEIEVEVWITE